jgi:hypothetical protein
MVQVDSTSARENLLSKLFPGLKAEGTSITPAPTAQTKGGASKTSGATIVDLSDRARAMLKQNEADQAVADKLQEQLAAIRATKNAKGPVQDLKSAAKIEPIQLMQDGLKSLDFKTIEDQERRMMGGEQLQLGQENMSPDEEFQDATMRSLVRTMLQLEGSGKTAAAADLRSAIASGNVQFQRASDVADLNMNYTYEKTATGERGGMDWRGATGEPAALLASNHAMTFSTPSKGAFFISW